MRAADPAVHYLVGHAGRAACAFGEASVAQAMARGATGGSVKLLVRGGRALLLGPKPLPRRQRACAAARRLKAVVGASQRNSPPCSLTRAELLMKRGRRARSVAQRLAPGRDRVARTHATFSYRLDRKRCGNTIARRPISATHQPP